MNFVPPWKTFSLIRCAVFADNANIAFCWQAKNCLFRIYKDLQIAQYGLMDTAWIKEALKQPGRNQRGLALAMGIDPSGVSRLLTGARDLKASELKALVGYLGVTPPSQVIGPRGMTEPPEFGHSHLKGSEVDPASARALPAVATLKRDVEVRGVAVGGEDAVFLFNGEVIDYAFFHFSPVFYENIDQIRRVEQLSDAYHLQFGEDDVMVMYLLKVTRKEG